jgi:PEP-CTERM motif
MLRSLLSLAAATALGLFASASASAVSFPLNVEFDAGTIGTFGNVEVTEVAGDLQFQITLDASLGGGADLHELYFNLVGPETGLAISSSDVVATPYTLLTAPQPAGGAGSSFGFGVSFGNGAGGPGNGVLQTASFVLSADGALSVADLLVSSSTSRNEVYMAAHVQGTSLVPGVTSETVGSQVPEPGTLGLLLLGLFGLGAAGQRQR